jgi:hypothetical protein
LVASAVDIIDAPSTSSASAPMRPGILCPDATRT